MSTIDQEIQQAFAQKLKEANEVFQKTVWTESSLAGKQAFMEILSKVIPKEYEWVTVVSGLGVAVTLVGYTPKRSELFRKGKSKAELN